MGNAAGAGAVKTLLSQSQRLEMETAVRKVTKIETATEPRFQDLFIAAMAFPHAYAPCPNLESIMTLPPRIEKNGSGEGDAGRDGQRRRRRS